MKQIRHFLLLGVFSTAVDYVVYSLLILLSFNYVIAIIVGYSFGLLFNYHMGRKYIFTKGTKLKSTHHEFFSVVGIAFIGMLLNILIVKLLSYMLFSLNPLYSRIIAIGIVFFWNYFLRKFFVYH